MPSHSSAVCVVIAAYNAEATVGRAIASALHESEVAEVVVVDDRSQDRTCETVRRTDDGTGRLRLVESHCNAGPAAARNRAIAASESPFVSILDSDDFLVPGRFAPLLADDDWDLVADNIAFVDTGNAATMPPLRHFEPHPQFLRLAEFVEDNISRRGRRRGETGFLKPVMRRSFLAAHGLCYDERLRLGEDYELYARALAHGARYKVVRSCGYVAVERPDSLSGMHRTEDLRLLHEADTALMRLPGVDAAALAAIRRHARQLKGKYEHRRFLDHKRQHGFASALRSALSRPGGIPAIAGGILSDKMDGMRITARNPAMTRGPAPVPRYLFPEGTGSN